MLQIASAGGITWVGVDHHRPSRADGKNEIVLPSLCLPKPADLPATAGDLLAHGSIPVLTNNIGAKAVQKIQSGTGIIGVCCGKVACHIRQKGHNEVFIAVGVHRAIGAGKGLGSHKEEGRSVDQVIALVVLERRRSHIIHKKAQMLACMSFRILFAFLHREVRLQYLDCYYISIISALLHRKYDSHFKYYYKYIIRITILCFAIQTEKHTTI